MNYFLLLFLSKSGPAYSSELMFSCSPACSICSHLILGKAECFHGWARVPGSLAQVVAGIKARIAFCLGRTCFLLLQILLAFATRACSFLTECNFTPSS